MIKSIFETLEDQGIRDLNTEQRARIAETNAYLQKHKINLLFQELLANLIESESTSPRRQLAEALKNKKERISFFNETDFEILFDTFDPYNTKALKLIQLVQGLQIIGIQTSEENIKKRYPSLTQKNYVYKDEFIDIMKNEYHVNLY